MINVVRNFLPPRLLNLIMQDFESKRSTPSFEINNFGRWGHGLANGSYGPVYVFPLDMFRDAIKNRFDQVEPIFQKYHLAVCYLHIWTCGSQITWHHDADHTVDRMSATIYLNEQWHRDWGGLFLYEEADKRTGWIEPEFNNLVWFKPPLYHAVSMVGLNAPEPRLSIQCFFNAI